MAQSSIPETMQAVQAVELNKPYEVRNIPVPTPGPNDILLKVAVASYCHIDSMLVSGALGSLLPLAASHEGAGIVVALGSSVTNFTIGDRVMAGITFHPCGTRTDCKGSEEADFAQYCSCAEGFAGLPTASYFAEYALADATQSVKLPDAVPFTTAAPLACAGCTVWRAITLSDLPAGSTLGIVGSGGGLGHLAVQFAKALGLRVIVIDARDEGLDVSRKYGADLVLDVRDPIEDAVGKVKEYTEGQGVHATLNLSDADGASGLSCAITRLHGTMYQIAAPDRVVLPFQEFVFGDIKVVDSLIAGPREAKGMLECVAKMGIRAEVNVFEGLGEIEKLMEMVHGGQMKGKAVVVVDEALV